MCVQVHQVVSALGFGAVLLVAPEQFCFELGVLVRFACVGIEVLNAIDFNNKSDIRNVEISPKQTCYFLFFLEKTFINPIFSANLLQNFPNDFVLVF